MSDDSDGYSDDYNYSYYDTYDELSVEERAADVLWTVRLADDTLTIRDAELAASKLAEAGLLVDETTEVQWGAGTVNEQGKLVVVAAPSRDAAARMVRHSDAKIVRRKVTEWEILPENDLEDD